LNYLSCNELTADISVEH